MELSLFNTKIFLLLALFYLDTEINMTIDCFVEWVLVIQDNIKKMLPSNVEMEFHSQKQDPSKRVLIFSLHQIKTLTETYYKASLRNCCYILHTLFIHLVLVQAAT